MKKKTLFFIALIALLAGCNADNADMEEARAEIVGKWQYYADGETEDDIEVVPYFSIAINDYFEFTEDGLIYHYDESLASKEKYYLTGSYSIDANYFYWYLRGGQLLQKCEYSFENKTMKLTKTEKCTSGVAYVSCTNIIIYKRLE